MTVKEAIEGFEMDNALLSGKEDGIVERNNMAIKALEMMNVYLQEEESSMDDLPLTCDCGCKKTIHKNPYYDEIGEVEYDSHCSECGEYLGHFVYGSWEY